MRYPIKQARESFAILSLQVSRDMKSIAAGPLSCHTNGRRTAVQIGGVLQYKWEVYCWVSLSSRLRSQARPAIQMGGVLPYKLEVYCRTFYETSRGWGFCNSSDESRDALRKV